MNADRILIGCSVKGKNSEYANLETEYLFKTLLKLEEIMIFVVLLLF